MHSGLLSVPTAQISLQSSQILRITDTKHHWHTIRLASAHPQSRPHSSLPDHFRSSLPQLLDTVASPESKGNLRHPVLIIAQTTTPSPTKMTTNEETISYPSIAIVLALGYVLYRYFFASSSSTTASSSQQQPRNGLRFTPAQVEQVAAMFPQLSRRDIMWDLQRNRGSVQGTIERVLGGGRLDAVSCVSLLWLEAPMACVGGQDSLE